MGHHSTPYLRLSTTVHSKLSTVHLLTSKLALNIKISVLRVSFFIIKSMDAHSSYKLIIMVYP